MATGGRRFLGQRLRHRIDIQRLRVEQGSSSAGGPGYVAEDFEPFLANVAAEKEALSGDELVAAAAIHAQVRTKFVIHVQDEPILPTMRVMHNGVAYDIRAVLPDETERRWLRLLVSSGLTEG